MPAPISRVGELDNDKIVEMSGGNRFNLVVMAPDTRREIARPNKYNMQFSNLSRNVVALLGLPTAGLCCG